jgi:hypothetical protein
MNENQFLGKDLKEFQIINKYEDLKIRLTKFKNNNNYTEFTDNLEATRELECYGNDEVKHGTYKFSIPIINYEKPKTIEEYLSLFKKHGFSVKFLDQDLELHYKNMSMHVWGPKYAQSIPFISLFLEEFFFSEKVTNRKIFPSTTSEIELKNIIKYFLIMFYENSFMLVEPQTRINLFFFHLNSVKPIINAIENAVYFLHHLHLNLKYNNMYFPISENTLRWREIYSFQSFNILLESLKEYKNYEAAALIMTLIIADFQAFIQFLNNIYFKAQLIETVTKTNLNKDSLKVLLNLEP